MYVDVGSGSQSQGVHGDCLSYLFYLKYLETHSCVENTSLENWIAPWMSEGTDPTCF